MKKVLYVSLLALAVLALVAPPAMAQEDKPFKVHGEVRWRGESQSNASDLNDNGHDNADFFPYRVRVAVEGSFAHNVAAYIEFQNANQSDGTFRNGIGSGGTTIELYQGNVTLNQLWSKNFSLRLGRQEIVAGNELLLGDLDFYSGITHDGGVGTWNLKKVNLMLWFTRPNQAGVFNPNFSPDTVTIGGQGLTQNFWGGYATLNLKKEQSLDFYLMDLDTKLASNVQTVGARWAHDVMAKKAFFWDIEVAQQFGDAAYGVTDTKAKGRAIEGWFGYNWRSRKNVHRIYGRYESATGDKGGTTDYEGFVPMFGDFHNRTGHGDWFQLQDATTLVGANYVVANGVVGGLKAISVGYNGFFNDRHEFGAAYWKYQLEQANGGSDDLGKAIDIWYGFNYSKNVSFTASLSQLNPGDALKAVAGGFDDSVRRLYGQARLRF